jgi:phage N-6-adenine-methyltransferase
MTSDVADSSVEDEDVEWYGQQKKNDWQTPEWLTDGLNDTLDGIDLDPCAGRYTDIGDTNWSIHYGEDGLDRAWRGYDSVFVNPPFSEKQQWVDKVVGEMPNTDLIMLLTPDSTDVQSWWHNGIVPHVSYVWFSKGRISYVDPETGEQAGSPTFGTSLSLFGDAPSELLEWLAEYGWLVEAVRR